MAVGRGFHLLDPQILDDGVAAGTRKARAEMHDVEKPVHLGHVGADIGRLDPLERLHVLVVEMLGQPPPLEDFVDPAQLRQAKRGRDAAHAGLVGRGRADDDGAALLQTMRAMTAHRHRDVDVVGHHHAALAAGQGGRLREIEHRDIAEAADQRALVSRADRLGGILDQHQAVLVRDRAQFRPLRGMAVVVAGDDGAGICGDAGFGLLRDQRSGPVVDVGEYRPRAGDADGVGGLAERIGRDDDFLSRTDPVSLQRDQEPERAARNRDGVFAADIGGERRLESLDRRPRGQFWRTHDSVDGLDLGHGDVGIGKRDEALIRVGNDGVVASCSASCSKSEIAHEITFLSASTMPLARSGSAVICTQ